MHILSPGDHPIIRQFPAIKSLILSLIPEEVGQLSREFLDQSNHAIFYASWPQNNYIQKGISYLFHSHTIFAH